jgi:hypothetical protein
MRSKQDCAEIARYEILYALERLLEDLNPNNVVMREKDAKKYTLIIYREMVKQINIFKKQIKLSSKKMSK